VDEGVPLTPGAEPDRVSAEEWLEEQRRSVQAEDEIRPVTELDIPASDEQLALMLHEGR
jgi:hypothetical protein